MNFERLTPMLWTNDIKASIDFYTTLLGFTVDVYHEEWQWCHMHKGTVNLMFARPNEHTPYTGTPCFTGSFYFYVEELDAFWESVCQQVRISYPIANFSHQMREFAILDNNGYMLQFGRELRAGEVADSE